MAVPTAVVVILFLAVVGAALGLMAYIAHRGNKTSDFFMEAVGSTYTAADLPPAEIDAYYELKDQLQEEHAPEHTAVVEAAAAAEEAGEEPPPVEQWTLKVPQEERTNLQKALMRRMVSGIGRLDQVQRDRPGNWKLWQTKLISERFWSSLLDAEKTVSQEIDECIAEAAEIEPGWRDHIFQQALHIYRMQRQQEEQKVQHQQQQKQAVSEQKMAVNNAEQAKTKAISEKRKEIEKELKRKETEAKKTVEEKDREEKAARKAMEELLMDEEKTEKKKTPKKAASKVEPKKKK